MAATWYAGNAGSSPVGSDANNGASAGSPKTITGAIAAAADGDTIIVLASATPYWQTGASTRNNFAKALTFQAQSKGAYDPDPYGGGLGTHPARFARTVIWDGLFGIASGVLKQLKFKDIKFQCSVWPASTSVTFDSTGIGWNAAQAPYMFMVMSAVKPEFEGCEIFYGYGPEGFAAYDPNRKYSEMNSPAFWGYNASTGAVESRAGPAGAGVWQGWGDATWLPYNHIGNAPGWIYCLNGGSFKETNCYIHDVTGNIHYVQDNVGGAKPECFYNWVERFYIDQLQVAIAGGELLGAVSHGCVIRTSFGHGWDSGNPHSDVHQHRSAPAAPSKLQMGIEMSNSLLDFSDGRSNAQGPFWGSDNDDALTHAAKIRNVLMIHANKLFQGGGIDQCYIRNVIAFTPTTKASRDGMASIQGDKNAGAVVAGNTKSLLLNVIGESIAGTAPWAKSNLLIIGKAGASVPLTDIFTSPNATPFATPHTAFAASTPKGGYAYMSLPFANVKAMIEAPYDFTGEQVFLGINDVSGADKNSAITSDLIYVHGGDVGDVLTISVSAGLTWRAVAADRTTQVSAYSGSAGTIQVGQYLQVRRTSSSVGATTQTGTITLAGVAFSWNVTTASDNTYPRAALVSSRMLRTANGFDSGSTSDYLSIFARFKASDVAAQQHRLAQWRAGYGHIAFYGTGLEINTYNQDGQDLANLGFYNSFVDATNTIELFLSIDATKADYASAVRFLKNGAAISPNTTGFNAARNPIALVEAASKFALFGRIDVAGEYFIGDFSVFALWPEFIDWSDSAKRAKTLPDWIGPNGEGVTGTKPAVFVVGKASELESANANRGRGGAMTRSGSVISAVAGDAQIWPPVLSLVSSVQSIAPYQVGRALTLRVAVNGTPDAFSLTAASDKAGSWATNPAPYATGDGYQDFIFLPTAIGTHTITFVASNGYIAPAPLVLEIVPAPVGHTYNFTLRFTDAAGATGDVAFTYTEPLEA